MLDGLRRAPFVVATHLVLILAASYCALWLRFDGTIPSVILAVYWQTVPWVLAVRGLVFIPFGLQSGLWRYTSIWDLTRIVLAVLISSVILYAFVYRALSSVGYPRSILIIESLLLISFVGGVRLLWRILPDAVRTKRGQRVLIVGAGDAGEMLVRDIRRGSSYDPVGIIDDDPSKVGRTIHGVKVLGTRQELARIVSETRPREVLVAMPSAPASIVRSLVHQLEPYKLSISTLPSLAELANRTVNVKQIRPLAIEDLLPRTQVTLEIDAVRELIHGKRVLVTGAGGSIGSELCRQIAALGPASLILYERYENSLYAIVNDLADHKLADSISPVIGDVADAARVNAVFAQYRPDIVFHAAAHKHVPLMEANPCEAIKNNVVGTKTLAEAASRHGVERFVLISTDKAANPSSVMGASKRVAEMIIQGVAQRSGTRFVAVRFGNVLGSNGSVIPRMLEQIRAGGPVTVTHPEMRRYFMLIPEAVQLVLHAAVRAQGGETFVLDMGEQLKILDVARNLIRLSGFVPDEEIPITFIGLRPGEKLREQLIGEGETLEPVEAGRIFRVRWPGMPEVDLGVDRISMLIQSAAHGQATDVVAHLRNIVPNFTPMASHLTETKTAAAFTALSTPQPQRRRGGAPSSTAQIAVPASAPQS